MDSQRGGRWEEDRCSSLFVPARRGCPVIQPVAAVILRRRGRPLTPGDRRRRHQKAPRARRGVTRAPVAPRSGPHRHLFEMKTALLVLAAAAVAAAAVIEKPTDSSGEPSQWL